MDDNSTISFNITRNVTSKNIEGPNKAVHVLVDKDIQLKQVSWYVYVTLACFNTLCHGIGGIFLILTYKQRKTSQHILLINLSATELLRNVTRMAICTIFILEGGETLSTYSLWTVYITTITYLYFSAMFLITADRIVATLLNIRHKIVCTPIRTKWIVVGVWSLVLLISITLSVYYHSIYGILWLYVCEVIHNIVVYRVIAVLTVLYLISVIGCYLFIFLRYAKSKRSITDSNLSTFQLFKRSKFYISFLLIISFLLLQVIPYGLLVLHKSLPLPIRMVLNISSELSDTADFIIYVFMYDPVFKLLKGYRNTLWMEISGRTRERMGSYLTRLIDTQVITTPSDNQQRETIEL